MSSELRPRLSFETLVVGAGNKLAATAARAVAERPGVVYNPLFIHGDTGIGKSHILMAVGHLVAQANPSLQVEYLSANQLTETYQAATAAGQSAAFRNRLIDVDVLLIDDVSLLANLNQVQTELIRILGDRQAAGKQTVVAASSAPSDISGLDERLTARLSSGLVVDISPPEYQTRLSILQERTEELGARLDEGVLQTVATYDIRSVRELVTMLNRLIALQAVGEQPLSADAARALLEGEALTVEQRLEGPAAETGGGRVVSEFEDFLSDVSSTVQQQIEAWHSHLNDAIAQWKEQGFVTTRLERLLEQPAAMPVEAVIEGFAQDVEQLRQLRQTATAVDSRLGENPIFADPDRVAEAETLVSQLQPELQPPPGPSAAWTFQTFVESEVNASATAMAREVVAQPGSGINPLLIVGGTGVGKTHLLHAIGNALGELLGTPVACLSAQDMCDGIEEASHQDRLSEWRTTMERAAALLVDDVHLLSGHDACQEELVRLVAAFSPSSRQLVFTVNQPIAEVTGLSDALVAQLSGGTAETLERPNRELRRAVVVRMLEERVGSADPELADYLAARPADSMRAVIGLVQRLFSTADSEDAAPSAALARRLIEGAVPKRRQTTDQIRTSGILVSPMGGVRSQEKMIWAWPDPAERLIEELS